MPLNSLYPAFRPPSMLSERARRRHPFPLNHLISSALCSAVFLVFALSYAHHVVHHRRLSLENAVESFLSAMYFSFLFEDDGGGHDECVASRSNRCVRWATF